ncbi:MAG: ABC transporter substrate-binding protein [Acidobacteria bacterium]|nr:ABC transporter substrate-binding protein [Acidobacteriota bacterium]MCW5949136.1 ABC transporter substrate-binding protein [Pyrinomonadaceae bacterium]
MKKTLLFLFVVAIFSTASTCRKRDSETVTVALPEKFSTFDTIGTVTSDAAAERVKNLMFNTLVRKNESFEYVGELASEISASPDGKVITFKLRDGVKFHNGKVFDSSDVKYTFAQLFEKNGFKAGAFFDTELVEKKDKPAPAPTASPSTDGQKATDPAKPVEKKETRRVPHILSIEAPDARTVIFTVARPDLRNQLLSNLVAIPIIADGTIDQQKDQPMGTGPFKFVSLDVGQNIVEMEANPEYWEGAPKIKKLRLKTVTDANSLQAELQTGAVDIAPNPTNISADTLRSLAASPMLKVEQSDGSNIQYLLLNSSQPPLNNLKIRQAIAYSIDRKRIVKELLFDQARVADSILPPASWAYSPGTTYDYDEAKAKALIKESGYANEPIVFKYGAGNLAVNQYAQVLQSSLTEVGLNVRIETLDLTTVREQLKQGQFNLYTGVWIGGNQDPIFFRDLYSTSKIPSDVVNCCNRGRYSNPDVDKLIADAMAETDKAKAKELYGKAWSIVSSEMPMLPLWYPSNMIVANKRIGNIKINASGDWGFLKDITADQ